MNARPDEEAVDVQDYGFATDAANVAADSWRWVAWSLHDSIANLDYPVGLGVAPNVAATERAAKLICEYVASHVDRALTQQKDDRG